MRLAKYIELLSFGFLFLASLSLFTFFVPVAGISVDVAKSFALTGLTLASLLALVIAWSLDRTIPLSPFTKKTLVLWALPLAFLITSFTSGSVSSSLIGVGFDQFTAFSVATFAALGFLFAYHAKNPHRKNILLYTISISAILGSLFQIVRIASASAWLSFGYFAEPITNLIGRWFDLPVLGALMLTVAMVYSIRKATGLAGVSVLLLATIGLFFVATISIPIIWTSLLLVGLYCFRLSRKVVSMGLEPERGFAKYLVLKQKYLSASIVVLAVIFIPFQVSTTQNPLFYQKGSITMLSGTRFNIPFSDTSNTFFNDSFAVAKQTLKEKPLTGVGPSMFSKEWVKAKPLSVNETPWWSVDYAVGAGLPVTFAVMAGALGLLAYLIIFVWGLKDSFMLARESARTLAYDKLALALSLALLLVYSLLYTTDLALFALLFILLALVSGEETASMDMPAEMSMSKGFIAQGALIVIALLLTFGFATRFGTYVHVMSSRVTPTSAVSALEKAVKVVPSDSYYRALHDAYTYAATQTGDEKLQADYVVKAEAAAQQAIAFDGSNYLNHVALANFYSQFVKSKPEAYKTASNEYALAMQLNPTSPTLPLLRARLDILNGDLKAAEPYIAHSLQDLKHNYTEAAVLYSQLKVTQKDAATALAAAQYAVQSNVNSASALYQYGMLLVQLKNYEAAIPALERLVYLSGDRPDAQVVFALGQSYKATGATDKALAVFQVLKQAYPDSADIQAQIDSLTKKPTPESTKTTTKKP